MTQTMEWRGTSTDNYGGGKAYFNSTGSAWEESPALRDFAFKTYVFPAIRSANSGDWNNAGTWEGGIVPGAGNNVIIRTNHKVALTDNASVGSIKFYDTGKLDLRDKKLSVSQDLIDSTPEVASAPIVSSTGSGILSFEGNAEQKVRSESGKIAETTIQADIEVK
ncbi:MAG: hypothetical protein JXA46_18270, partial [Dehalococcoidales bacterium]|nr:hypothetical protein [Dehalococcoidales bacterium]